MYKKNYKILLEWCGKDRERFLGSEEIHLTNEELAKLLGIRARYPDFIGGDMLLHIIYLDRVQALVEHKIDLDLYDYFISSMTIGGDFKKD